MLFVSVFSFATENIGISAEIVNKKASYDVGETINVRIYYNNPDGAYNVGDIYGAFTFDMDKVTLTKATGSTITVGHDAELDEDISIGAKEFAQGTLTESGDYRNQVQFYFETADYSIASVDGSPLRLGTVTFKTIEEGSAEFAFHNVKVHQYVTEDDKDNTVSYPIDYTNDTAVIAHDWDDGTVIVHVYTGPDLTSHRWNSGDLIVEANCSESGEILYTCLDNAKHTKIVYIAPDQTTHNWNRGEITKVATCTESGEKTYTCTRDASHTKKEVIPVNPSAHTIVPVAEVPASCEVAGTGAHYKCTLCNKLFSDASGDNEIAKAPVIEALGHNWNSGEITKVATCTESGEKTYTCTRDASHTRKEVIAKVAHKIVKVEAVEATTSKTGNIEHYKCTECGTLFKDKEGTIVLTKDDVTIAKKSSSGGGGGGSSSSTTTKTTTTYKITTEVGKGGTVSPKNPSVEKSKNQEIKITPNKGYKVKDVKIDGKSIGAVLSYTFSNVKATHTIEVTFEEDLIQYGGGDLSGDATFRFIDVKDDDWFNEEVYKSFYASIFKGTSDTEFGPNKPLTRGMVVTVIYRLDNASEKEKAKFIDVEQDMYYSEPISWAAKNEIVKGIDTGIFAPERNITRQDLACIIYRYVKYKTGTIKEYSDVKLENYTDHAEIADYAVEPMKWAIGAGLIKGNDDGSLKPTGYATRAQAATIMNRLVSYLLGN